MIASILPGFGTLYVDVALGRTVVISMGCEVNSEVKEKPHAKTIFLLLFLRENNLCFSFYFIPFIVHSFYSTQALRDRDFAIRRKGNSVWNTWMDSLLKRTEFAA